MINRRSASGTREICPTEGALFDHRQALNISAAKNGGFRGGKGARQ